MKPANFPDRQNARRLRAIAQLKDTAAYGSPRIPSDAAAALANTLSRLVPHETARAIRTKKDRAIYARFQR